MSVETVRDFVLKHIPKARHLNIGNNAQLLDEGLLDSLGILDLVTFLEETFQIVVEDEELTPENFQSIAAIAAFVQRKIHDSKDP